MSLHHKSLRSYTKFGWVVTVALLLFALMFTYLSSTHCTFGTENRDHLTRMLDELKAAQKLPPDFPVALYPGAVLEQVSELDAPKGKVLKASLVIKPATTVEKVTDFYKSELTNRGYKVFNTRIRLPITIERRKLPDGRLIGSPITAIGPQTTGIKQDTMVTVDVRTDSTNDRTDVVVTKHPIR